MIERAMARQPGERFASMQALAVGLRQALRLEEAAEDRSELDSAPRDMPRRALPPTADQGDERHVPLLVLAGKGDDDRSTMETQAWSAMKARGAGAADGNVDRRSLVIHRPAELPTAGNDWAEVTYQFDSQLTSLNAALGGQAVFHVFLNCPAALAVGLGAITGPRHSPVLYHYFAGSYVPVMDFNALMREHGLGGQVIKQTAAQPFRWIEAQPPGDGPRRLLFVSLHLSSQQNDPGNMVRQLAAAQGAAAAFVRNTYGGVLKPDDDWLRAAREVATALSPWLNEGRVEMTHLFLNCPVPLAFAIGMALGVQPRITIHHWFRSSGRYHPVLVLNKLRRAGQASSRWKSPWKSRRS